MLDRTQQHRGLVERERRRELTSPAADGHLGSGAQVAPVAGSARVRPEAARHRATCQQRRLSRRTRVRPRRALRLAVLLPITHTQLTPRALPATEEARGCTPNTEGANLGEEVVLVALGAGVGEGLAGASGGGVEPAREGVGADAPKMRQLTGVTACTFSRGVRRWFSLYTGKC